MKNTSHLLSKKEMIEKENITKKCTLTNINKTRY